MNVLVSMAAGSPAISARPDEKPGTFRAIGFINKGFHKNYWFQLAAKNLNTYNWYIK